MITEKQSSIPIMEEIANTSFPEKTEIKKELSLFMPIQRREVVGVFFANDLDVSKNIPILDSIKKEKQPSKRLQRSRNRLDKMLPFRLDKYLTIKSIDLNKSESVETNLVLDKNKEHLIRFCDTKIKTRNTKAVEVEAEIEITQNGTPISVKKTDEGFVFTPSQHRTYKIIAKNLPKIANLTMVIYEYSDYALYPTISLLDAKGSRVKWKGGKDSETELNQKFQLIFSEKGKFEDLHIEEVLVTVRNKEKGVTFEKIITNETFSLADLPIQKGDWVVVQITEFSGKLQGEVVKNPKRKGFGSDDVFTFAINPKIK
jgi:hypothetical protein